MPSTSEAYVDGLQDVYRAFRRLPKEASNELRDASQDIASRYMVPAWQKAAREKAGPWGDEIANSVRTKRDRIPAVNIGYNKRAFSGGASTNMVRAPSHLGPSGKWHTKPVQERTFAPFQKTDWITRATYIKPALKEWSKAVDRIVAKWDVM